METNSGPPTKIGDPGIMATTCVYQCHVTVHGPHKKKEAYFGIYPVSCVFQRSMRGCIMRADLVDIDHEKIYERVIPLLFNFK